MKGRALIEIIKEDPQYDPESFSQKITLENEEAEEGETEYTIQQGADFLIVYDDEGNVVAREVPEGE